MVFVDKKLDIFGQKYESLLLQNNEIIKSLQFITDQQEDLKNRVDAIESSHAKDKSDLIDLKTKIPFYQIQSHNKMTELTDLNTSINNATLN